jgi:hypothetical protein
LPPVADIAEPISSAFAAVTEARQIPRIELDGYVRCPPDCGRLGAEKDPSQVDSAEAVPFIKALLLAGATANT